MSKVAFMTLGCKVNQADTEAMQGLFAARGYEVVSFDSVADVYVLNTCSVTHLGERKSRQCIRRAIRTNPEAVVAVTGCYAQVAAAEVAAIPGVDLIVGTQDRQHIVDLLEQAAKEDGQVQAVGDIMAANIFEDVPLAEEAPGRTRAFLKIQEGCENYCTYCIIPYARGRLRSRSLESVRREAAKLIRQGFAEIVLTGIHLGAYGREWQDEKRTLTAAVQEILALPGLGRLRISSMESIEVEPELLQLMSRDARLCPHLHLPLQGGDNRLLKAMNRHYTTEGFATQAEEIRRLLPDVAISTDIIVGFPGETEEMFENSLVFVEYIGFAKVHVFPYSRRTGTPAATFAQQVPENVKKERVQRMQEVAVKSAARFTGTFTGRTMEVLFEHPGPDGRPTGLTGNYLRVKLPAQAEDLAGRTLAVQLLEVREDYFEGRLSES
nr:tRNA (N(6)-L-threonylcarbamoyladenosine(37)-C(2))-methylthiotransferase MtaB [uncultured Anaeromusa sp.]